MALRSFATGSASGKGIVNQNWLPWPNWLVTPISPPIRPTSRFEMARPRPVPPYRRVTELSACTKFWKSLAQVSGVMPAPVSVTLKRTARLPFFGISGPSATVTSIPTCPAEVNFSALPIRLDRICLSLKGSPKAHSGTSGAMTEAISKVLS